MKKIITGIFLCLTILGHSTEYRIQDLDILFAESSFPTSINERGDVVGCLKDQDGTRHVFFWTKEKGLSIPDDIPKGAYPSKINNLGQVVGNFYSLEGRIFNPRWVLHGFIWSQEKGFKDLGTLRSLNTSAFDINDNGEVAVFLKYQGKVEGKWIQANGDVITIDDFLPTGLNNTGVIVGYMTDVFQPGIFKEGTLTNLNDCMLSIEEQPFIYETISSVCGINDEGFIIGTVRLWNANHAVLLIPQNPK